MMQHAENEGSTRRRFLIRTAELAGGLALVSVLPGGASATPETMMAAIKKVVGDKPVRKGKVTLDVPPLIENGNSVSLEVTVESPMSLDDHVKAIQIFNEKNPLPNVISAHLGPRAGKAFLATRIRLADSQKLIAIAELGDGTFWSDQVDVIVTIAACLEVP